MPAVAPLVLHPRFVLPTHWAVSLLLRQWLALQLPSELRMLGIASWARSSLISALGAKLLPAVAFNHDALRTPPVDCTHLHFLHLVVRFEALNNLRHRCRSPSPPGPFLHHVVVPKQLGTPRRS